MSWTGPVTHATGDLITAAGYNAEITENLKWLAGSGGTLELGYDQITAPVNVVSTVEGAPTAIIAGTSRTYENRPYLFHFFTPLFTPPSTTGGTARCLLMQDGSSVGRIAYAVNDVTGGQGIVSVDGFLRFTPSAGAHTFGISAYAGVTTGTPSIGAGAGGSGVDVPAFLRAARA